MTTPRDPRDAHAHPLQPGDHDALWRVCRLLPTDYAPWGDRPREGPDCSCGCVHYVPLAGARGDDWGVCTGPESPRRGTLTFEHQGCPQFEARECGATDAGERKERRG